ncbi:PGAP1-domain-containing protein [Pluteus cervinus]|uniref:PGAP1-domain-containing protein n=1 Tax=Pluteus cervinus TaxID=181527 RepID=A0ACD3AL04_9AGAR|nr:PGAP1-domain-containing protein [Pluteus cervinus]
MPSLALLLLSVFSVVSIVLLYLSNIDATQTLSPQGCRMSYMWPSYALQEKFDTSWTPLANRYSLWLYREVDREPREIGYGLPVLFIPGNAGSSHQVRSIASSAANQFYASPYHPNPELSSRGLKRLDFFAVEFNEDLSAFHSSTLRSQIDYTAQAVRYILSLYPPGTKIIVMAHSMGGVIATALLPSPDISSIITMSTPHKLPPIRFDSGIDAIYDRIERVLQDDTTPIVSICGGAMDVLINSEACVLGARNSTLSYLRRTVFTSALEGAWTGVGHQEMVWCHQVRWRIARAALELATASSPEGRAEILDTWLRDGSTLPPGEKGRDGPFVLKDDIVNILGKGEHLSVVNPKQRGAYLLPIPVDANTRLVVYVSGGGIDSVSPQVASLKVSISSCVPHQEGTTIYLCTTLRPTTLRLIPNPSSGSVFPVPQQGVDESDGVVMFEASLPSSSNTRWISVHVEKTAGSGWVYAGFAPDSIVSTDVRTPIILGGKVIIPLPTETTLHSIVRLPRVLTHALLAYRVEPVIVQGESHCAEPLLSPLLLHQSSQFEAHYFPLIKAHDRRILIHSHLSGPYVAPLPGSPSGIQFDILATGSQSCGIGVVGLKFELDWTASLGRLAMRYPTTVLTWMIGVASLIIFDAWGASEGTNAPLSPVSASLSFYSGTRLVQVMLVSFVMGFVPLPEKYYLGTRGEPIFALLAPFILLLASGLVFIVWGVLSVLMWPFGILGRRISRRFVEELRVRRSTIFWMCFLLLLVFFFVPWQAVFMGCWAVQLWTCASTLYRLPIPGTTPTPGATSPSMGRNSNDETRERDDSKSNGRPSSPGQKKPQDWRFLAMDDANQNMHILFLMTLLIPFAVPALVVWVRTLITAGITTPFGGDHSIFKALPFLIYVDFTRWTAGPVLERQSFEDRLSLRWVFAGLAGTAFLLGPRQPYSVFDAASTVMGVVVIVRIGLRYWGGPAWSPEEDKKDH